MWWRRRRALDTLDKAIRDHLAREIDDNLARGMAPEEARRQAHIAFGNATHVRERTRQVWSWVWLDQARQDARYAARALRRNPAYAVATSATLALAIGANTAMFGVLQAVVLEPLPYRSPDELTILWREDSARQVRQQRSDLQTVDAWRRQALR
jgi:hypothetical protein